MDFYHYKILLSLSQSLYWFIIGFHTEGSKAGPGERETAGFQAGPRGGATPTARFPHDPCQDVQI